MIRLLLLVLVVVPTALSYNPDDDEYDDFDSPQMWCSHRVYMGSRTGYVCPSNLTTIHLLYAQSSTHNINKSLVLEFDVILPSNDRGCDGGQTLLVECDQDTSLPSTPFKQWLVPDSNAFHIVLNYKGQKLMNHMMIHHIDSTRHLYRIVVHSTGRYELQLDGRVHSEGDIRDWSQLDYRKSVGNSTNLTDEVLFQVLPLVKADELGALNDSSSSTWILSISIIIAIGIIGIISFCTYKRFTRDQPSSNDGGDSTSYRYSVLKKKQEEDDYMDSLERGDAPVSHNESNTDSERITLLPYRRLGHSSKGDANHNSSFTSNVKHYELYHAGQFGCVFAFTKGRVFLAYFDFSCYYNNLLIIWEVRYQNGRDEDIAHLRTQLMSIPAAGSTLQKFETQVEENEKQLNAVVSKYEKLSGGFHSCQDIVDDLNDDDLYQLIESEDELHRAGQFRRIFPSTKARENLLLINREE